MAKQLNVNLALSANTDQAKRQLQELQKQLSQLSSISINKDLPLTQELLKASSAAAQLQSHLKAATDVNTGKLDLGKFNQQMTASGMSLAKYQKALSNLGPVGDKAFAQLAQSISTADARLLHANTVMGQFVTSLKNTVRWQLSSSMLHGFMGAIQSAYGYAQDLNKSLNSIRIVTGQSVEQMDAFAQRANKAAKALSTTTTAYTDAALIFYQQGLGEKEVEERTNAVIKMSNVTGDSATEVSSYMTAIWNNFDNGSESLEHYADVITALGASTASSSAEIAAGLEKFASVAETIGLSYNYSTAALATIVANTRQSADTVGTGLRTIFSRLQGLSLGETLDDGTNLNKYSKALKTVGVDILDASGKMKNMDTILTNLAGKWDSLSKAQQTALAQTVGGVRQYTNLIALMNNWDDMEENLRTAENSEGSLQEQADIYAESWEAAQKRVKASAQAIYQSLLDDKFFIKTANVFADFLNIIDKVIDGLGGVKGVLLLVGSVVTRVFNKEISNAINSMAMGLMGLTKKGKQRIEDLRTEANDRLIKNATNDGTVSGGATAATYQEQGRLQNILIKNASHLTEAEREQAQLLIDINRKLGEEARNRAEVLKAAEREVVAQKKLIDLSTRTANKTNVNNAIAKSEKEVSRAAHRQDTNVSLSMQRESGKKLGSADNISRMQAQVKTLQEGMKALGTTSQEYLGQKAGKAFDDLATKIDNVAAHYDENGEVIKGHSEQLEQAIEELKLSFQNWDAVMWQTQNSEEARSVAIQRIAQAMAGEGQVTDELKAKAEALVTAMEKAAAAENQQAEASGRVAQQGGKAAEEIKKMANAPQSMTSAITQAASAMMSLGMVITSVISLFNTLNDEEASTGDKIMALITTVGMLVPAIMSIVPAFSTASVSATAFGTTATAAGKAASMALWQVTLIVAAITAIAAVVIALVSSINANSPEAKLKKAEENAKALGESLDEAKSHAEELKNAFDGYQTIVDKLKNCTKGTQEWKDALEEANAKTSELLAQYPELLSKANLFDENGILNIDVLQEALDDANEAVTALNAATLMAQADVQQAKVDVAKKDFAQDNEKYVIQTENGPMYNYGAANKDLETLLSSYKTIGNSSLELSDAYAVLNIDMKNATESEQKLANSLLNLANQSIAAANAVDNASISVINSWAKDQNIELEVGQSALMSDAYNETYESVSKAVKAASDTNNKANDKDYSKLSGDLFEGTSFEGMSVSEAFNQARGTNYNLARNGVRGTDDNRTYAYLENGEEKEYTIEEMQATIAASVALEKMGAAADAASASLNALDDNVGEDIGNGIKNWLASGNFESMNKADFEKMTEGIAQDENGNYDKTALEEYLKQAFNTDDVAGLLGDDWYDRFNSAAQNFSTALNNITTNMSENAKKAYNSINNLEDLTLGDQKTLANLVQDAYINNGTEGANALVEQINNAFANGAKTEDVMEFTNIVNGIDWDTASIADFRNALSNAGIDVAALGIDIDAIFEAMTDGGSRTLSSIQDNYKKIQDIVKDLQSGDTISDEDYNTLVSQLGADAVDGYFSVMADGTHRLVGDAEDFYRAITENTRQQMLGNISNANILSDSLEGTSAARMNSGGIGTQETSAAAVAYLQTLQLTEEETAKLAEIQDSYNQTGSYTAENMAKLDELMANHQITEEQFRELIEQNNIALRENSEALLSSATSLSELDGLAAQVVEASGGAVYGYAEALISLASQYDNCAKEIEAYQQALTSGNEATIAAAQDSLRAAVTIGELSDKYNLVAEDVETQAKLLRVNRQELDLTEEEAARLAVANQRMNRGVETLNKNFKKWKKVLNSADHTTQDYAETLNDAYDALADLTGAVDAASIPLDFLDSNTADGAKHLQWMEKAANGDVQAINLLGSALAVASVKAMKLDESFAKAFADATQTDISNVGNKFIELQNTVSTAMNDIHNAIESGMSVDQIQAKIDSMGTGWVDSLNQMAIATGMSVDQMNSLLNQLGVQAQVEVKDVPQKMKVPTYTEYSQSELVSAAEYETVDGVRTLTKPSTWKRKTWTVPGESIEVDGVVQVAQISTEGNPMSPAIKYTGTGGSSRGGGVSPSSTSSGGGGGGSDKPKEHNSGERKDVKDEKERYHVIKNQIEDLTSAYDRISKAKDRAFGSARLANLNKEIDAQKKLNDANQKYLEEIEGYLGTDKALMAGYGAQFDANGTITNYDALIQNAVNEYNAAVEAFNQAYTDDEGAKEAMEAAEKRYEQFMKDLKQYEETQDLYKDQLQQTIDDANALRDLLLERTQLQVELKVDVAEDSLKLLEQLFDNIENKAYDAAEAFGYLNQMTSNYFDQLNAYNSGLQSLFANQGLSEADFNKFVNGDTATFNRLVDMLSDGESAGFSAEDVSTIREYLDGLLEANENLREIRQTVHEQILTVWEEWGEKIDAGISKIEHLQAITESYQNIIDIVGQKNLGVSDAFMSKMRQQSIDQANDKLVAEKARYDELRKARDAAYAKFEEQKAKGILSPEEIKTWEESLAQMDEDVNSASEDFQSAWEDALNGINEAFEAEVQQIVDAYSDAAAGLLSSISELQEAFDRRSDLASQYLEDYEKIYQFNKLNRDIEKSVDETNNVRAKKELLELQSKITALQEAGVDISKYEMEQLRQEYELKKAQIELEEAQDSKSQVQMQRDSDGNYSYVYTANTDDVANAEANYADKLHDMQVSNAEYIQDLQSNMVQMEQDYQDKVQEIIFDTSLSAEERMAKLNEVNQYYDEKMKFYISEAQLWEQNSQRLYEQDWTNYATMTGYKISEENKWLDHWNETQLSMLTGFDTLEEYQSNHNVNVANLLLESGIAFATWQTNIETAMNNAGTSIGTFEQNATEELNIVAEEYDKLKDSIVNMAADTNQAVRSIVEEVDNWENSYSKTIQNMLTKNTALITSFNQLLAVWSKVEAATLRNSSGSENNGSDSGNGNNGSSSGSSRSSSDNSTKVEGVAAAIWIDGGVSGWGNGSSRSAKLAEKGVAAAQSYINAHGPNGDIYRDWVNKRGQLKQYYYGAFDTGGYTGAWGAEGKFAMLHEKELVLNKEDTTNFLQAIDIIRQISDTIDLNALSSSGGLSSLFAATASSSAQTLQQEVTIHAEFPNATDRDEISAAFSDLVNLASQYANRK